MHNPSIPNPGGRRGAARGLGGDRRGAQERGFTILELLMSIMIIGILMGLLIVGAVYVTKTARGTSDRQALLGIKAGVVEFRKEFGFLPPLMKEQIDIDEAVGTPNPSTIAAGTGRQRVDVYLNSVDADVMELHRWPDPGINASNPLEDVRFSTRSLAVYVAGALNEKARTQDPVPLDGVVGPGLYKPTQDGTFVVPADVLAASATSARAGTVYQPFVNLGSSPKLYQSPVSPFKVELRDSRDAPIRYYRWLTGRENPGGSRRFVVENTVDLRVPAMVARDFTDPNFNFLKYRENRDIKANTAVRGAAYALVSAGPNKLFGDEPPAELARVLGHGDWTGWTNAQLLAYRAEAEEDNIVEVGQ